MAFLTLPHELVERILLLLSTESLQTCMLVNRALNEIIQSSTLLQYFQACQIAGVIDNPQSPLSYAERLEALKRQEEVWRKLKPVFEMKISVNRRTTEIFRSTEGVFFLPDDNRKDLNYCHLTPLPQQNPQWIKIPGHGPALNWSGTLVNFATALHEHDLVANFISSDVGNQAGRQWHSLDFVLLRFSTGEYHPLAHRSRIHVQRSPEAEPRVNSKIVGDNLALVVHRNDGTFSDKLFIFDWKTGHKLLQHEATEGEWLAYSTLDFVSPELLIVPNCNLSHFEVWHLPPYQLNRKPPTQILSLQVPAVSRAFHLTRFDCYGDPWLPSPFPHTMPYPSPRPFFSSPENSIFVAKLGTWSLSGHRALYDLVMHRRALLDTIQTWTSPSLLQQQRYLSRWLTNEVTVHQIADAEDGSFQLDAQSKMVSTTPHPRYSPRTRGPSSVSSGSSTHSSTSRCTFLRVPWARWGPPISRWFQVDAETQDSWFGNSIGQRCAISKPSPRNWRKSIVSVADFNPHNFRRKVEMMPRLRTEKGANNSSNSDDEGSEDEDEDEEDEDEEEGDEDEEQGNEDEEEEEEDEEEEEEEEEEEFEILDHEGVFSEKVYMGLKCVVYHAPGEYDFDLVLMDEQRLLGMMLKHYREGWFWERVNVFYIG